MSEERSGDTVAAIAARVAVLSEENARLFRELAAAERRFRSVSRAVFRVQEDERRRLARELHDGIGQTLTALKNHLESARDERLGEAVAMASQALDDTRELSRLLRPAVLDDLGLGPALRWLARTVKERFGIETELALSGVDERFDPETETLAFRVVQEALTNVAKHSGADRARVAVERKGAHLRIAVADSGRGFDARHVLAGTQDGGVGLRGMRDRAELFGGTLAVSSEPGGGTRLEIAVPIPLADEATR